LKPPAVKEKTENERKLSMNKDSYWNCQKTVQNMQRRSVGHFN